MMMRNAREVEVENSLNFENFVNLKFSQEGVLSIVFVGLKIII